MGETFTAAVQQYKTVSWLWLIPLFPFVVAVINGLSGKKLQDRFGKRPNHTIAIAMMAAAAAVAVAAFVEPVRLPPHARFLLDTVFPMIHVGKFHVDMAFAIDPLSGMMA